MTAVWQASTPIVILAMSVNHARQASTAKKVVLSATVFARPGAMESSAERSVLSAEQERNRNRAQAHVNCACQGLSAMLTRAIVLSVKLESIQALARLHVQPVLLASSLQSHRAAAQHAPEELFLA